jgi:hypothetical protein
LCTQTGTTQGILDVTGQKKPDVKPEKEQINKIYPTNKKINVLLFERSNPRCLREINDAKRKAYKKRIYVL